MAEVAEGFQADGGIPGLGEAAGGTSEPADVQGGGAGPEGVAQEAQEGAESLDDEPGLVNGGIWGEGEAADLGGGGVGEEGAQAAEFGMKPQRTSQFEGRRGRSLPDGRAGRHAGAEVLMSR